MKDLWKLVEESWRVEAPKTRPEDERALEFMNRALSNLDTTNTWDELDADDDDDDDD
ncbi:hypothetical protein [Exiguobacterium sp. ZOR0005]|uniref:hypothetical protein n=1 Tax=Exiguobacterium sp. ZOR0005 TaxID=1339226 RepID=UPI000A420F24|nr:hypothetical protein [Exiguobacterium sp. ZOR0005]